MAHCRSDFDALVALKKSLVRARPLVNCGGCELTPALRQARTKVLIMPPGREIAAGPLSLNCRNFTSSLNFSDC